MVNSTIRPIQMTVRAINIDTNRECFSGVVHLPNDIILSYKNAVIGVQKEVPGFQVLRYTISAPIGQVLGEMPLIILHGRIVANQA